MKPVTIIALVSLAFWLIPLYKQYGTKYFYFFLVNAYAAPIIFTLYCFTGLKTNLFFPTSYLLMFTAIVGRKYRIYLLIFTIVITVISPILNPPTRILFGISFLIDMGILIVIMTEVLEDIFRDYELNLFTVLLFTYLCIDVIKLLDIALSLHLGAVYYFFGVVSQLVFAVSFGFINVHTKAFKLKAGLLKDLD